MRTEQPQASLSQTLQRWSQLQRPLAVCHYPALPTRRQLTFTTALPLPAHVAVTKSFASYLDSLERRICLLAASSSRQALTQPPEPTGSSPAPSPSQLGQPYCRSGGLSAAEEYSRAVLAKRQRVAVGSYQQLQHTTRPVGPSLALVLDEAAAHLAVAGSSRLQQVSSTHYIRPDARDRELEDDADSCASCTTGSPHRQSFSYGASSRKRGRTSPSS